MDIDDPLKPVPFKRKHIGEVKEAYEYIRRKASIKGTLENAHFSPRSAELRWNKALKEEDDIEPKPDVYSEEVPPPAE